MMFTAREQQLIRLLVQRGLSSKEAAWELHISHKTAETHRHNIMRKLREALDISEYDTATTVDLVLYAVTHDLVDMSVIYSKYGLSIPSPS